MQVIEINEPEFSNDAIKNTIDLILKSDSIDEVDFSEKSKKGINIGDLMMGITDKNLLNSVLEMLKSHRFFTNKKEFSTLMNNLASIPEINAALSVRIEAICYGILLKYESYLKYFDRPENLYFPSLKVEINKSWVKCNLDEVIDEVNGGKIINIKNELEKLPLDIRIIKYKEVLRIMAAVSIDHNTDELKKHIERLNVLKENLPHYEENLNSNLEEKDKNKLWFKLGPLFAQGKISQKRFDFFYENLVFKSERELAKHIGKNILNIERPSSLRQYLHETLYDTEHPKNIYSFDKVNSIYRHCIKNKIPMCRFFLQKQKEAKQYTI